MGNDRKKVRVAAAVIRKGELVFATQRGYGAYKDWWEFPGGKIEEGETPEEALIREIREELDADITVDEYITTVEYDYPDFHLSMSCYRCSLKNEHMTLLEHEAAKWMRADNLRQVNWLPADIVIVNILEAENRTLKYYENNADSFVQDTVSADMSGARQRFMEYLPRQARILDFGCGSGRDIKFFLDKGYIVDGTDGSPELCRIASDYTGIGVKQMRFQELDAEELYDGIWACASILHLPKEELTEVFHRIERALKTGGILYTSFKYGTFEGMRNGRYFTDFTEDSLREYWKEFPVLKLQKSWITQDVRPGKEQERWLNILAERQEADSGSSRQASQQRETDDGTRRQSSGIGQENAGAGQVQNTEERIAFYEQIYDDLRAAVHEGEESGELRRKLSLLEDYYSSGEWRKDYETDEAGLLPAGLKRGVLSQDGVYDLLAEWEEKMDSCPR